MKRMMFLGGIFAILTAMATDTTDRDGDGLPDVWEIQFGMRTNSASGIDGADGDPDGDGLSNRAEYLAAGNHDFFGGPPYAHEVFVTHPELSLEFYDNSVVITNLIDNATFIATNVFAFAYTNLITVSYTSGIPGYAVSETTTTIIMTNLYHYIDVDPGIITNTLVFPLILSLTYTTNKYSALSGLSPTNAHSFGSYYSDYFIRQAKRKDYLGWWFSDNDFVDSAWENVSSNGASPRLYDVGLSNARSTLDAWSRCRMFSAGVTNPVVDFDLHYYGVTDPNRTVTICAYSTATMDGVPDATYVLTGMNKRHVNCVPSTGALRSGTIYFTATGGTTWTPSEPFGIATPLGVEFGWDRISATIELTDYTTGYLRVELDSGLRPEDVYFGTSQPGGGESSALKTHVRVARMSVDDNVSYQETVLDKWVALRGYLHEGDLLADGQLALDWGLVGVPDYMNRTRVVYSVVLGDHPLVTSNKVVAVFTNAFDATRALAAAHYPIDCGYVYAARPTFKWTMPENYTAFTLEIRQSSWTGPVIYNSGAMQAPVRNIAGECVWTAPIYANARLANGQIFESGRFYVWRVIAMNAKFSNTSGNWSAWRTFQLGVNPMVVPEGYGSINANVKYFGPAANFVGLVKVQAFRNAAFSGLPEVEYTLDADDLQLFTSSSADINAVLYVGSTGPVYLRAFIDTNSNGVRDIWEAWGYVNYMGLSAAPHLPYDARPVYPAKETLIPLVDILIQDTNIDQDWMSDTWEYEQNPGSEMFLDLLGM